VPVCSTCNDTGVVNRKVWEDLPTISGVHPAILAGTPAQRTIKQFPCPACQPYPGGKAPQYKPTGVIRLPAQAAGGPPMTCKFTKKKEP
jgi:hypothetical protein